MLSEAGLTGERQVGEVFNPWRGVCGFYPPDVVAALPTVMVIGTRRKLSHGHKALYTRLVRRWGQTGPCFPDQAWLAKKLGVSIRTVKMWIGDLEAFGLIKRRRRGRAVGGGGQTNEYGFLWHSIFEVQKQHPTAGVLKCKNNGFEVQDSALSKCNTQQALYREETRTRETGTSSSSTEQSGRFEEASKPDGMATTSATMPVRDETITPIQPRPWTEEEIRQAREAMRKHFGASTLPDPHLTLEVLKHMLRLDDVHLWLLDLTARRVKPRGWGFYSYDAQKWPARRDDAQRQVDAKQRVTDSDVALEALNDPLTNAEAYFDSLPIDQQQPLVTVARARLEERLAAEIARATQEISDLSRKSDCAFNNSPYSDDGHRLVAKARQLETRLHQLRQEKRKLEHDESLAREQAIDDISKQMQQPKPIPIDTRRAEQGQRDAA